MPSTRSRKRQSRLSFTSMPSSSPASKDYNQQIRDRAAAVTIATSASPYKRRKIEFEKPLDSQSKAAPTDAATLSPAALLEKNFQGDAENDDDSDDLPVRVTPLRSTKSSARTHHSRQQRLDFSSARHPETFDPPLRLASSPRRTRSSKPSIFSSSGQNRTSDTTSEDSSGTDERANPRRISTRSRRAKKHESNDDKVGRSGSLYSGQEDESDVIHVSTSRVRDQKEEMPEASDDEDDPMPTTQGTHRRKQRRATPSNSLITDSSPPLLESDDDFDIIRKPSRALRRQADKDENVDGVESEDKDEEPFTPRRRLKKQSRQLSQRDKDDLAEDLDFLGPGSDAEANFRSSQSMQKSAKQKALERLKKSRSGKAQTVGGDGNSGERQASQQTVETIDDDDDDNDDDDEKSVEELSETEEAPLYTSSRQMFKEDDDDADFLVEEDEEAPLGVPDGVPLEFTRYASMKPKALFKYAIDWMVQKKINPAFKNDDPLYALTFGKLDDEVRGLAGSKFTSSSWTRDFTVALQARPEIAYEHIERLSAEHLMRDKCDACNRSGHPATYQIQFQGMPYDRETLTDVSQGDEDESDSGSFHDEAHDDEQADWDKQGRKVVPISTIFYVGKFCMSNAATAHALQHWKYHLNAVVETSLLRSGYCAPAEEAKRARWSDKKRRKFANKIVDRMEESGELKALWRNFRHNIETARISKQGRFEASSP